MSDYFVGVDVGGSHAEAVVIDEAGRELARGRGPGAIVSAASATASAEIVAEAVGMAVGPAGLELPARALWAGMAGAGRVDVCAQARNALAEAGLASTVGVGTDVEAAFESAFGDGPGILLIAGTGSIAVGRATDGRMARAGGWGAVLGDEGGGYWIALQALGCVARAVDGRAQPTELENLLIGHLGLADPYALIPWVGQSSKSEVAALAPLVLGAARSGDTVAASIVTDAAAALRSHVIAVVERLSDSGEDDEDDQDDQDGEEDEVLRLALWGGLIGEGGWLRPAVERLIEPIGLELRPGPIDPAFGAARLAARLVDASF